ncbi:NAD(P)-dependent alcohol dehydrogenase [Moraxellaceae bacterium AER2_44_116]|jgi:NADPH:quinone reductase-like Zn-dependent oxidoreductase|nr:NAD(P)-dependent alcohol dehydrogenase [Moraxellaceae bacterium AER2_44_116]
MKTILTSGWGLNTRLVLGETHKPTPRDYEVLVEVGAASVNPKDWKLNYHLAILATPLGIHHLPPLFGDDLAGIIVAKGCKVTRFEVGDAVYGMDMRLRTASLAEYAVINECRIAHMPTNINFNEAASVPLAAQTALQGLRKGNARVGSAVLIIGASGGVGTFAVQIAKAMGCQVTAVCGTNNVGLVKSLGADSVIDYRQHDYRKIDEKFDIVFDVTAYETPMSCANLLKYNAFFISTAGTARALFTALRHQKQRTAIIKVESYQDDLNTITKWIESGLVKPVIDSIFPLKDSQKAYEKSRSGRACGKIVIEVKP